MKVYGSPVLNPLSSLVILFSIGNWGHCVMGRQKKERLLMREMASCGISQQKSPSRKKGKFWQEIATDQIIKIFH